MLNLEPEHLNASEDCMLNPETEKGLVQCTSPFEKVPGTGLEPARR